MSASTPPAARRPGATLAAFALGLPLAAALFAAVHYGPLRHPIVERYLSSPAEIAEATLFCLALGALASKARNLVRERLACRDDALPHWDGKPVDVEEAPRLLAYLSGLPRRLQPTWFVQRLRGALDFLVRRKTTDGYDDQLRALTDNDAVAHDASYGLTRFITWAIPILGFLGTVLGIAGAISGVKSDDLELSKVTGGLAEAFDATALALGLTMITMFLTFLLERGEAGVLERVDAYVDAHLAHRFCRPPDEKPAETPTVPAVAEQIATRQAELWAQALAAVEQRAVAAAAPAQEKLTAALDAALARALASHAERVAALERHFAAQGKALADQLTTLAAVLHQTGHDQAAALKRLGEAVGAQAGALAAVQQGERHIIQLQTALQQNLNALAGAGAFEQAVHTLTAAVHLLTARAAGPSRAAAPSIINLQKTAPEPGKAA
jgi:biopolymer transport protein ExbB/TolQ